MQAINRNNLSRDVSNLDQALYVASCFAGSAAKGAVVIYCTTREGIAETETGERYLVLDEDDNTRFHLRADEGWRPVYRLEGLGE